VIVRVLFAGVVALLVVGTESMAQSLPSLSILDVPDGSIQALDPFSCHQETPRFWLDDETEIIVSAQTVEVDPRLVVYARHEAAGTLEPVWNGSVAHHYDSLGGLFSLAALDLNADGQDELVITEAGMHGGSSWFLGRDARGHWQPLMSARGWEGMRSTSRVGYEILDTVSRLWGRSADGQDMCWQWDIGRPVEFMRGEPGRCGHLPDEGELPARDVGLILLVSPSYRDEVLEQAARELTERGQDFSCGGKID